MERPLYGVEVFVGETARFEIEISEPDVHPIWKLKDETLTPSPVRLLFIFRPQFTPEKKKKKKQQLLNGYLE